MTTPQSQPDLLRQAFEIYDEEFAEYVGEIATPDEYELTADQEVEVARIFMFGYALGTLAGAHTEAPATLELETDLERVEGVVEDVVSLNSGNEIEVSATRVAADFRNE